MPTENNTCSCCSYLYQIAHLGDDDDEPEFSSAMELEEGTTFFFTPRGLKNLVLVDEIESLAPIMSCQVPYVTVTNSKWFASACTLTDNGNDAIKCSKLQVEQQAIYCTKVSLYRLYGIIVVINKSTGNGKLCVICFYNKSIRIRRHRQFLTLCDC